MPDLNTAFPQARFVRAGQSAAVISTLAAAWALLSPAVQDAENTFIEGLSDLKVLAITSFPVSGGGIPAPAGPGGQLIVVNEVTGGANVTDGTTTVSAPSVLQFTGATVTNAGGGTANIIVSAGSAPQITQGGNLSASTSIAASATRDQWLVGVLTTDTTLTVTGIVTGGRVKALLTQDGSGNHAFSVSDGTTPAAIAVPQSPGQVFVVEIDCTDSSTLVVTTLSVPGPTGPTGGPGPTGSRGSAWFIYTGSGTPTGLTGVQNGDIAIRTSDAEIFKFVSGAWTDQGFTIGIPAAVTQSVYDAIMPWTQGFLVPALIDDAPVKVGTWLPSHSATAGVLDYALNSPAAQNDSIGWDFALAAGTWNLSLSRLTNPSSGINTVAIDGVTVGTIDSYSVGTVNDVATTITGITIASNGKHRITFTALTKNASSTGFTLPMSRIELRRTA